MSKFSGFAKFFMKNRFKTFKAIFSSHVFFSKCFDPEKSMQIV